MDNTGILAQGTELAIRTGTSPYTWTPIANVASITNIGGGSATQINATHLQSTAKEYRTGLKDNGTVSLKLFWDDTDAGQLACRTAQTASSVEHFQLTLPDGDTPVATFMASVSKFSLDLNPDAMADTSMDLLLTGDITWSA